MTEQPEPHVCRWPHCACAELVCGDRPQAAPAGWKLVPVEPTEKMVEAFHCEEGEGAYTKWDAMLAAAPSAQAAPDVVEQAASEAAMRRALRRLERAVDLHLGRSGWTQTKHLKGLGYSQKVREELYAAHDEARAALSAADQERK